jgi:hypothetical protein
MSTKKQMMDCSIYYSMIGTPFFIFERNTDENIWLSKAWVQLHFHSVPSLEAQPAGLYNSIDSYDLCESEKNGISLEIPHEILGGPFFSSETQCIIVNGKNQILKLGNEYRFQIRMYRSLAHPEMFNVRFTKKYFAAEPLWISF